MSLTRCIRIFRGGLITQYQRQTCLVLLARYFDRWVNVGQFVPCTLNRRSRKDSIENARSLLSRLIGVVAPLFQNKELTARKENAVDKG